MRLRPGTTLSLVLHLLVEAMHPLVRYSSRALLPPQLTRWAHTVYTLPRPLPLQHHALAREVRAHFLLERAGEVGQELAEGEGCAGGRQHGMQLFKGSCARGVICGDGQCSHGFFEALVLVRLVPQRLLDAVHKVFGSKFPIT